jgi:hypothetical protein
LWNEYEFGIGNRKPAKLFTAAERGKVKYIYYRRKIVWDNIAELVRSGLDAKTACDKIYTVYGANRSDTSTIIRQMRADRARKGHPGLHVPNL